jgi:hypothetical protein
MVEHSELPPVAGLAGRLRYATIAVFVAVQLGWIATLGWLAVLVVT